MRNVANSPRFLRLLAAMAVAFLATTSAQAQTTLRWQFQPGETLKYQMVQKANSKLTQMERSVETMLSQTMDTTWTIKSVENGVADVVVKIERHRLNLTAPNATINYDSQEGKPIEGPAGQALNGILSAMAGSEFALKMDERGEITDVKVPQKILDAVKALPNAGAGGNFSEDRLKDQFKQSTLVFPKDPVKPGANWTGKMDIPSQPVSITLDNTYTYAGPNSQKGGLEEIDVKIDLTIKPAANAQIKVDVKSQDGKGSFLFDQKRGYLSESSITRKLELGFNAGGTVLTQVVDSVETMKLNP